MEPWWASETSIKNTCPDTKPLNGAVGFCWQLLNRFKQFYEMKLWMCDAFTLGSMSRGPKQNFGAPCRSKVVNAIIYVPVIAFCSYIFYISYIIPLPYLLQITIMPE